MKIPALFRKTIFGIHFPQEYLCIVKESFEQSFKVEWLDEKHNLIEDVSFNHRLLGYKPVLFTLNISSDVAPQRSFLSFTYKEKEIALLELNKVNDLPNEFSSVHLYRCIHGEHWFISQLAKWTNTMLAFLKNNSRGDIKPVSNHYEQVRIAYSVPRAVAMITISDGHLYNLFPVDLHGSLSGNLYAFTLRENSKSSEQVERIGKVVLSEVNINSKKDIQTTAKNHIKEMRQSGNFPFSSLSSLNLKFLLPEGCTIYYELELVGMKDFGFHHMCFFKIIHQQKLTNNPSTFSHLHRYAAEWRRKNNISTPYE